MTLRAVDAGIHPGSLAHDLGEHAELIRSPPPLAFHATLGKRRLLNDTVHQRIPETFDLVGHALEKGGTICWWTATHFAEGRLCLLHGRIDL